MRVISSFLSKDRNKKMLEYCLDIVEHKGTKALRKLIDMYRQQKGTKFNVDTDEIAKSVVENANTHDLTEITMKAIDKELKDCGVSPGMRKRARFDMNANSNSSWWKREISKHKYAWRYLIDEKHSDRCIYRMRNKYIGKTHSTIQIQFEQGWDISNMDINTNLKKQLRQLPNRNEISTVLSPFYTYNKIPNPIVVVMCIIPLSYLTKNNYFAGAWNFFWYAWWFKNQPPGTFMRKLLIKGYWSGWNKFDPNQEKYENAIENYKLSWSTWNKPFKILKSNRIKKTWKVKFTNVK